MTTHQPTPDQSNQAAVWYYSNTWGLVEGFWGLWTEVGRDTFRVSCLRM